MKKILLSMLTLLLVAVGLLCLPLQPASPTRAEQLPPAAQVWVEGLVTEVTPEGLMLTTDSGRQLLAMTGADTTLRADAPIAVGDWVRIGYDGLVSREPRGRLAALEITCHRLTGTVGDAVEGGFLLICEGRTVTLLTEEPLTAGTQITVYAEDITGDTVTPLKLRGPELTGVITGVTEVGILLEPDNLTKAAWTADGLQVTGTQKELLILTDSNTLAGLRIEAEQQVRVVLRTQEDAGGLTADMVLPK